MSTPTQDYSHPDQAVRHSYPLNAGEEGFSAALSLCLKTMPYILLRIGILAGFTLAAIVWLALCGGVAYLFSGKDGGGGGGMILFLIGFGIPAGLFFWLRQYVLYLIKCGHIAVLTKLITDGALPEGVNQVEYGKKIVCDRFAQTNVLFVIDSLVTGTARAFNRTLDWVAGLIPIPGLESLMQVVNRIVDNATTFVDETIFSYNLARGDDNMWRSSRDGLVYYAANVKPILKTAIISLLIEYGATFVVFLVCLIPAYLLSLVLPGSVSGFAWIFAIFLAAGVRSAVLRPVFLTMVMLTFHKNAQNQPINESLSAQLESLSSKFVELKEKAASFVSGKPAEAKI